jgi:dTDP-4-dehydrorhamnose 3,5-epimerase
MVKLVSWSQHRDDRGWFAETYKPSYLPEQVFVQDNMSRSAKGVIRGLHFQPGMGKLMRVTRGSAFLVALDLRSTDITETVCYTLSSETPCAVWAPDWYARGFQALTDDTEVCYKCTATYNPATEGAVRWDSVGIQWPLKPTIISPKDRTAQTFDEYKRQPRF